MSNWVMVQEHLEKGDFPSLLGVLEDHIDDNYFTFSEWKELLVILESHFFQFSSQLEERALSVIFTIAKKTNDDDKSLEIINNLLKRFPKESYYKEKTYLLKKLGKLQKLNKSFETYMQYLYRKRSVDIIDLELDKFYESLDSEIYLDWKVKCIVHSFAKKRLIDLIEKEALKSSEKVLTILKKFLSYFNVRDCAYWYDKKINEKIIVNGNNLKGFLDKKTMAIFFMDYIASTKKENRIEIDLIHFCREWGYMYLGHQVSTLLDDQESEDYFLVNMPTEMMKEESFDYGEDLLNTKKEKELVENNLEDSSSMPVSMYGQRINFDYREKINMTVRLEDEDVGFLLENYSDIIASLHMLENYNYAVTIIDQILASDIDENTITDLTYLKAISYVKTKSFYQARDLLYDYINSNALIEKEKLVFLYLLGEVYEQLDDYDNAAFYFKKVQAISPGYRLVNSKLTKIGEGL